MKNCAVRRVWSRGRGAALRAVVVLAATTATLSAGPVTFEFEPPPSTISRNPYARELWATVTTPSGRTLRLPAFYMDDGVFAVNARPDERGTYHVARVTETTGGTRPVDVAARYVSSRQFEVRAPSAVPSVGRDPRHATAFMTSDGKPFIPVGANVAWPKGDCVPYYHRAFDAFGKSGLNWMRIWMAHWGHLNLDWIPAPMGRSPPPATIDNRVAANWDQLLDAAERNRVYVQIVLQHHGQYATKVNPNWNENPWNAANPGGFLRRPADFFTSPEARFITMLKYRYIVARWSWSPAVFAWELFNEVHWVDAISQDHDIRIVANWCAAMADYIRSIDAYRHLITISTEDLRSPIYARMDFYQPHLYPADLVAGGLTSRVPGGVTDKPIFYGEEGDEQSDISDAAKKSGLGIIPPVWAALFGETRMPAAPWFGWNLLADGRLGELGAVRRFIGGSGFARQHDLVPFTAVVDSSTRIPLSVPGAQMWLRQTPPVIRLPLDGREPTTLGRVPRIYVGSRAAVAEGFPDRVTYQFALAKPTVVRGRIVAVEKGRAGIRFVLDGHTVAEKSWTVEAPDRPQPGRPSEISFAVPAGRHELAVANARFGGWVEVESVDFGVAESILGAVGQRSPDFIAAWIWNRRGIAALDPGTGASGRLDLDHVAPGIWVATWWDAVHGTASSREQVHVGEDGELRIPTPLIARYAAVVIVPVKSEKFGKSQSRGF